MCVVSAIEFNKNPSKYLTIAQHERVVIEGEDVSYELVMTPNKAKYISAEEVVAGVTRHIEAKHKNK